MTDKQIIKLLKNCSCLKCPLSAIYNDDKGLLKNALDLINRQRAEIERLEKELQQSEQEADITETVLEERNKDIYDLISKERSNAILEFAEALKQEADNYVAGDDFVTVDEIDNLVKEMTEEEK